MSSTNYEENGYSLDLDLLTISASVMLHILGYLRNKQPFTTHQPSRLPYHTLLLVYEKHTINSVISTLIMSLTH